MCSLQYYPRAREGQEDEQIGLGSCPSCFGKTGGQRMTCHLSAPSASQKDVELAAGGKPKHGGSAKPSQQLECASCPAPYKPVKSGGCCVGNDCVECPKASVKKDAMLVGGALLTALLVLGVYYMMQKRRK